MMRYRSPEIRIHRILQFTFFILHLLLLACSCEKSTTAPPPPGPEIVLTLAEEPYLTEISLKLELRNLPLPQQLLITRNDSTIFNGLLTTNDTLVNDAGLKPATTYRYRAYRLVEGQKTDSSALLQAGTMDTTSHDFQWEIIEFPSSYGSGVLRDVTIINENDIWAVGEIYSDSAQPWLPYNAVHWDGQQWELKRIPTNSVVGLGFYPLMAVFAFDSDNIWMFSDAGSYCHWNGTNWQSQYVSQRQGGINKIWGSSPTNIYFVGTNGNITHYDGRRWQKLESGTELDFRDIWGAWNHQSEDWEIIAVASKQFVSYDRLIVQIKGLTPTTLSDKGINWSLSGVWFSPGHNYYVAGSGIYEKRGLSEEQWKNGPLDITSYYICGIRGNNINDAGAAGGYGEVLHFNGSTWKSFFNTTHLSGNYYSVAMQGNLIVAVGYNYPRAAITIGRRGIQ